MRTIIVLIGAACIALGLAVEKSTSLFQVVFTLMSLTNSALCGVFGLALFYPRASHKVCTTWTDWFDICDMSEERLILMHNTQGTIYGAIASVVILGWFMTTAQVYNVGHNTTFKPLPSSIDGCAEFNITVATIVYAILEPNRKSVLIRLYLPNRSTQQRSQEPVDDIISVYQTSFMWYSLFGSTIVWIVALALSHSVAPAPNKRIDARLLSPLVRWMYRTDATRQHIEMAAVRLTALKEGGANKSEEIVYAVQ